MHVDDPLLKALHAVGVQAAIPTAPSSSASAPSSVDAMKDVAQLAKQAGFTKGVAIHAKKGERENDEGVFKILNVTKEGFELKQADGDVTHTIRYKDALENWVRFTGKLTTELVECNAASCSPLNSVEWRLLAVKGAVAIAMEEELKNHEEFAFENLTVYENPRSLRTKNMISKGGLKVVAASSNLQNKMVRKDAVGIGSFEIGGKSVPMLVGPQIKMPINNDGEAAEKPWVAHFWLVQQGAETVNMELTWTPHQVGPYTVYVPILTSKRKLGKGDVLLQANQDEAPVPMAQNRRPEARASCAYISGRCWSCGVAIVQNVHV